MTTFMMQIIGGISRMLWYIYKSYRIARFGKKSCSLFIHTHCTNGILCRRKKSETHWLLWYRAYKLITVHYNAHASFTHLLSIDGGHWLYSFWSIRFPFKVSPSHPWQCFLIPDKTVDPIKRSGLGRSLGAAAWWARRAPSVTLSLRPISHKN